MQYTSVFKDSRKVSIRFSGGFASVNFGYDEKGLLIEKGNRWFYYKLDAKANPVASVAIEKGMKMFEFFRLTYADGTSSGSLTPDQDFINQWNTNANTN